jgi:hypothetical protein
MAALLLVGVTATGYWQAEHPAGPTLEFATEEGSTAGEGPVNSPLKIVVRIPEQGEYTGESVASVSVELVDESGRPATFGPATGGVISLRSVSQPGEWEYQGSMPSVPGNYRARITISPTAANAQPKALEPAAPTLRAKADQAPALKSGLAFASEGDLWLLSTDGARERRLTYFARPAESAAEPEWSPDGRLIAFVHSSTAAGAQVPATAIWTVRADGRDARHIVASGPSEVLSRPGWGDAGRSLYFGVDTLPNAQDALGNPGTNAGRARRIDRADLGGVRTTTVLGAQAPSANEAGKSLIYFEDTPPLDPGGSPGQQLVRAGPDGSGRLVLVGPGLFQRIHVAKLSPDDKWVVFSATNGAPPRAGTQDPLSWLLFQPVTVYAHDVLWDLFIVSSSGGEARRLTTLNEDLPYPAWLDARTVAFMGATGVYRLAISDLGAAVGKPVRLRQGVRHATLSWHGP